MWTLRDACSQSRDPGHVMLTSAPCAEPVAHDADPRARGSLLSTLPMAEGGRVAAATPLRTHQRSPPLGGGRLRQYRGLSETRSLQMLSHGQPRVRASAQDGTGLGLVTPALARMWLHDGKAEMLQRLPCHVRITCPHAEATRKRHFAREAPAVIGIDPGYKTTGIIARIGEDVVFAIEIEHRTGEITSNMGQRASYRRGRRGRRAKKQRRRGAPPKEARFSNRRRDEDWLPPSLRHLHGSILCWVRWLVDTHGGRIRAVVESAVFDPHLLRNPEVSGTGYQEGPLYRSHLYRALSERDGHRCAYCAKKDERLECDHVVPKARGGSDSIANRVLACRPCNQKKGAQDVRDFLRRRPARLARILANLKRPLRAATADEHRPTAHRRRHSRHGGRRHRDHQRRHRRHAPSLRSRKIALRGRARRKLGRRGRRTTHHLHPPRAHPRHRARATTGRPAHQEGVPHAQEGRRPRRRAQGTAPLRHRLRRPRRASE